MSFRFAGIHSAARSLGATIVAVTLFTGSPGLAGGYDTGERDWDFLFQSSKLALRLGATGIWPDRDLGNVTGALGPSGSTPEAESFSLTSMRLAVHINDDLRCMGSKHQPYSGHAVYDPSWRYAASAVRQDFSSRSLDFTCAYGFSAGRGQLSFILGVSDQKIRYELAQDLSALNAAQGMARTDVSDSATIWRAGVAYELPEYALRASLIFNSGARYDMRGTYTTKAGSFPIKGGLRMPSSVELKVQSGIAEKTLAFGSITHTQWSRTADMPLCPVGTPDCSLASALSGLTLQWRDTTRITLGLARQVSNKVTLTGAVTYDQGASQGFTAQSTVRSLTLGTVIQIVENASLNLSATYGWMESGLVDTSTLTGGIPNPVGYVATYGNDRVTSLRTALTFRF